MRRTPLYFICAGLELARYFALVYAAGPFTAASPSAPQLFRLLAAPNAVFAVAFFFLGLDRARYAAYRPLMLVGKSVALFSGAIALPRLLGFGGSPDPAGASTFAVIGVAAWDAVSVALLAFDRRSPGAEPDGRSAGPAGSVHGGNAPGGGPEIVELD